MKQNQKSKSTEITQELVVLKRTTSKQIYYFIYYGLISELDLIFSKLSYMPLGFFLISSIIVTPPLEQSTFEPVIELCGTDLPSHDLLNIDLASWMLK